MEETQVDLYHDLAATLDDPVISLHALVGIYSSQTLKIHGFIKHQLVVVLIDSGSTHKFVHYFIWVISNFHVLIVDEGTMKCERCSENIKLKMGDYHLKTHMFSIEMGGYDIFLGAKWM